MKGLPVIVCVATLVMGGSAPAEAARPGEESATAARVRALRARIQQNERQIRSLEAGVQARRERSSTAGGAAAPGTPVSPGGEISAWSNAEAKPATLPPASPTPPAAAPQASRKWLISSWKGPGAERLPVTPGRNKTLAMVQLKRGASQARVWAVLGAPEFVRGHKEGVQYWHYGNGWVRFQEGQVTRWQQDTAGLPTTAARP